MMHTLMSRVLRHARRSGHRERGRPPDDQPAPGRSGQGSIGGHRGRSPNSTAFRQGVLLSSGNAPCSRCFVPAPGSHVAPEQRKGA
jgi:hypothetical protein